MKDEEHTHTHTHTHTYIYIYIYRERERERERVRMEGKYRSNIYKSVGLKGTRAFATEGSDQISA